MGDVVLYSNSITQPAGTELNSLDTWSRPGGTQLQRLTVIKSHCDLPYWMPLDQDLMDTVGPNLDLKIQTVQKNLKKF
jgi:hypothetical protein